MSQNTIIYLSSAEHHKNAKKAKLIE